MGKNIDGDLRTVLKPYLGHWDVPETGDLILTIDHVQADEVKNEHGTETKPVIYFREPGYKPMICNATNRNNIAKALGSDKARDWSGKQIAIYEANESRSKDGKALRVRDYRPKTDEIYCDDCGSLVTDHVADGKTYKAKAIANNALTRFGRYLCWDCAAAAKAVEEGE